MLSEVSLGLMGGLMTGVSGMALASILTPSLRAKVLSPPEESLLSDLMQFDFMEEDQETLVTKDGQRVKVLHLKGCDQSAKTRSEIQALLAQKQLWLEQLFEHQIHFKGITTRREYPHSMEGSYKNPLLQKLHDQWMKGFEQTYTTDHYLMLTSASPKKKSFRTAPRAQRGGALNDSVTLCLEALSAYNPVVLRNEGQESPLLSFWGSLLCRERLVFPCYTQELCEKIVSTPVEFDSQEGIILYETVSCKTYEAVLGIKTWGEESQASILREILSLPFEMTVLHQMKGIACHKARSRLNFKKAHQNSHMGREELVAALELINGEEASLCSYQFSLFLKAKNRETLEKALKRVNALLRNYGMVGVREREAIEWVWRCQFPGFETLLRPTHFLSHNLSHFMNLDTTACGQQNSDWGPGPLRYFKTATGGSYAFQFHVSEEKEALGHSVMIAPTGSGKTTLVQHLIAGALRHKGFKAFIFDRLQGTKIFTQSLGGTSIDLSSGHIPLNPFVSEDSSFNRLFLQKFLLKLSKAEPSPKVSTSIAQALDLIFQVPKEKRLLNDLFEALFAPTSALKEGLKPWVQRGAYGHWFNGSRQGMAYDALDFAASSLVSFEMEHIQEDPYLAGIMTDYIFFKIRSSMMSQSYPHFVFVDEAKAQMADSDFKEDLKAALNQQRKLRGVVCLAFQSPEQIKEVGLEGSITTQCPTVFLFPNPGARPQSYEMFNLSEAEWEYIAGRNKLARVLKHSVLVKRQNESVILDIDLKSLGSYLRLYKSGNESVQLVKRLQEQLGEKGWIDSYLKAA